MTKSKNLFNAFDKDFQNDPYPTYERLRREDPIHRSIFNTWVITRYADAGAILKDRRFQVDNLPERLKQKNRYLKDVVSIYIGAANRDPEQFINPD
jgi:hypothetical protein